MESHRRVQARLPRLLAPAWLASHTHPRDPGDIHRDVITRVNGRWAFNGKLTVRQDGHHSWTWPISWPGAEHPKLGPGKPSLIFVVDVGDPFEDHPNEIISRVIGTVVASPYNHIGELVTKRTARMAEYFAALDRAPCDGGNRRYGQGSVLKTSTGLISDGRMCGCWLMRDGLSLSASRRCSAL